MTSEQERQISRLRTAFEDGALDEETYEAAVSAILGTSFHTETDTGTVAQGAEATAVGERGVSVGGNVGGHVITGDQIIDPEKMDPEALRAAYLSRVLAGCNQLWLGGIDPKAATEENERMQLSAVYTGLLTENQRETDLDSSIEWKQDQVAFSALEQLNWHKHLVLLGDPGSGKSTFVNFVAACLAGEAVGHRRVGLDLMTAPLPLDETERRRGGEKEEPLSQPWDHGALLPVFVVLRDLAARGLPAQGQKARAGHLWRFIEAELDDASLGEYAPLLKKELMEKGGLFLFDGLDEVPKAEQHRLHIKQLIEDLVCTYPKCRVLVTSRIYAYQKQDWRLSNFTETTLAPFSKGQIVRFVKRWYKHIAAARQLDLTDARGRAQLLQQVIFNSKRLYVLAERPLLLTLMASLHAWRGGSLPEKREQLYADSVALLLDAWEKQRIVRDAAGEVQVIQPSLEQWLQVDRDKVRGLLNRLAYEAHASQLDLVGTADIAESDLVMGLLSLSEENNLQPKRLVEFLSNRAGLLLSRGVGVYTFPHRTFQEYLAARHLTGSGYPAQVAQLARQDPGRWREVALLAGAKAAAGSDYALWGLVQELCYEAPGEGNEKAYWGAHLAGHFVVETADLNQLTAAQSGHVTRLRDWLVHVLTDPVLPTIERVMAGRHLAQLRDPRPEVTEVDGMHFCYVPAGPCWLGEGDEVHYIDFVDYDYWLARYPVTHTQYMAFIEDGGYEQERWWKEAMAAGRWENGHYTFPSPRVGLRNRGAKFRLANLPVAGISWYEAKAFTRWLTERWQTKGWLPVDWRVMLPSEVEWEKAARGGLQIPCQPVVRPVSAFTVTPSLTLRDNPKPQRAYTWLDSDLTPERANYRDSEVNQTSSVGAYRESASVYGCEEMLGNVYEWTRSLEKAYPYTLEDGREQLQPSGFELMIMRGFGWLSKGRVVRCAARYRYVPVSDVMYAGFRVMLSPRSSSFR